MTTTNQVMSDNAEQAAGLRALADMLDQYPEFAHIFEYSLAQIDVFVKGETAKDDLAGLIRAGMRLGANVDKRAYGNYMTAVLNFGSVRLHVNATREEVCERVVVGTEMVAKTVPDPVALAAVPDVEVIEEVEKVKWICRPLLAAEGGA